MPYSKPNGPRKSHVILIELSSGKAPKTIKDISFGPQFQKGTRANAERIEVDARERERENGGFKFPVTGQKLQKS